MKQVIETISIVCSNIIIVNFCLVIVNFGCIAVRAITPQFVPCQKWSPGPIMAAKDGLPLSQVVSQPKSFFLWSDRAPLER